MFEVVRPTGQCILVTQDETFGLVLPKSHMKGLKYALGIAQVAEHHTGEFIRTHCGGGDRGPTGELPGRSLEESLEGQGGNWNVQRINLQVRNEDTVGQA